MAAAALVLAMNDGQRTVHPFFNKLSVPSAQPAGYDTLADQENDNHASDSSSSTNRPEQEHQQPDGSTKCQEFHASEASVPNFDGSNEAPAKRSAHKRLGKGGKQKRLDGTIIPTDTPEHVVNQNVARRKRRRTSHNEAKDVGISEQAQPIQGSEDVMVPASSPVTVPTSSMGSEIVPPTPSEGSAVVPESSPVPATGPGNTLDPASAKEENAATSDKTASQHRTPPQKMLKLRAGGKLASPDAAPRPEDPTGAVKKPAKRGRPKRKKEPLIAVCRYSVQQEGIGMRIERILSGEERYVAQVQPVSVPAVAPSNPRMTERPTKGTHPFFLGKPKDTAPATMSESTDGQANGLQGSPRRPSAITPGKMRMQARELRGLKDSTALSQPSFGMARDRHMIKHPGLREAAWPSRESLHVRGAQEEDAVNPHQHSMAESIVPGRALRKNKARVTTLDPQETVIHRSQSTSSFEPKEVFGPDGFLCAVDDLRAPEKLLITGPSLQSRVHQNLSAPVDHPATKPIYDSITTTLTPFDEGKCESQSWNQKYAPMTAAQISQTGREAEILRDWMRALTVMSVEGTSGQAKVEKPEPKHKKKRRKKNTELDDFIVDSDDDRPQPLDELTDPEDVDMSSAQGLQKRTVVRPIITGDGTTSSKVANAILISGPPGCGKTTMVSAVAKELSFQIFEINAGSRRSGRDILERIGDMTENHLVQRHSADAQKSSAEEETSALTDFAKSGLDSGRQGTMNSFFKPKATSQGTKKPMKSKLPKAVHTIAPTSKPARNQKQSLISLEEVDVLFDEDKNFWTTVFALIATSKRPIIMTCNNEDLVPTQALSLHAILRSLPPPVDLATDYLSLLAAREGHVIDRASAMTLFKTKGLDLRASIADLQFFCQMGVGDPRGGLSWIFQRWPPGKGVDADGNILRIGSAGTYQVGMGFLSYEASTSQSTEELCAEAWSDWSIDPREALFGSVGDRIPNSSAVVSDRKNNLAALKRYDSMVESISATDVFCKIGTAEDKHVAMDPSQPEIPAKARLNYIDGLRLLQADEAADYTAMDTKLAIGVCGLASSCFQEPGTPSTALITPSSALSSIMLQQGPYRPETQSTRRDFSAALDPISEPVTNVSSSSTGSLYSVLDGPFATITQDIAPYVRSIVQYDLALEEQRMHLSSSLEGRIGKRARTTRAARSALEGGQRQSTRRERWFSGALNMDLVSKTGGQEWPRTMVPNTDISNPSGSSSQESVSAAGSADELMASQE